MKDCQMEVLVPVLIMLNLCTVLDVHSSVDSLRSQQVPSSDAGFAWFSTELVFQHGKFSIPAGFCGTDSVFSHRKIRQKSQPFNNGMQ